MTFDIHDGQLMTDDALEVPVATKVELNETFVQKEGTSTSSVDSKSVIEQNDTFIEKIGRMEAELCFYRMEVQELGTPLGRLKTIQAYFDKMERSWGCHRNMARKLLEHELVRQGCSDRTILRMMPAEQKDPIKRANRLGKTKLNMQVSAFKPIDRSQERVGACYQDPD